MESYSTPIGKNKKDKKKWIKIFIAFLLLLIFIIGGILFWKTGSFLNKISTQSEFLKSLVHTLPGVKDELKGEKEGRINILLLGMRGENVPGGGLLADTIIVISIKLNENKVAMISIPRDLYVENVIWGNKTKINAIYAAGEEKNKKQGIDSMKKTVENVLGIPIHYGVSIDFFGFKKLVDAIGGIEITLEKPFSESLQFRGLEKRCDGVNFTVPSGNKETKKVKRKDGSFYFKHYPLCYAKTNPADLECGGNFFLPAGNQTLNGDKALCYVRSRVTSNDFERAKRQQIVIQAIKNKFLSAETITDFEKINEVLKVLGDHLKTDMQLWEIKRSLEIYQEQKDKNIQIIQKVLENSKEGLLYNPNTNNGTGYILLPIGDNYDKIHEMAQNIFNT